MTLRQPHRMVSRARALSVSRSVPAGAIKSTGLYCGFNAPCHLLRIGKNIVLPYTEHEPSTLPKTPEVALVAPPVSLDLLLPIGGELVPPGRKSPSVPEVSIDEDCNLGTSEH